MLLWQYDDSMKGDLYRLLGKRIMNRKYYDWLITESFGNGDLISEDKYSYMSADEVKEVLLRRVQKVKFYCPSIFNCGTEKVDDIKASESSYSAFADMGTWKVLISACVSNG